MDPRSTPHTHLGIDVKQASVSELVALHHSIVSELVARKVSHTRSSPTADLPLLLASVAYDGKVADRDCTWDLDTAERRLVVRGRLRSPNDRTSIAFAPLPDGDFDAAVFIVLDATTCVVESAVEVPASALTGGEAATRRIRIDTPLIDRDGARDMTTEVEKAMHTVDVERFARRHDDSGSTNNEAQPTGRCMCGCGQPTDPGARFLVMHDRRAESPTLRETYGSIRGLVV